MKIFNYTITALLVITVITALFSDMNTSLGKWIILILSGIKFILVAFNFIEMRTSNPVWKGILIGFIGVFVLMMGFLTS